MHIVCNIGSGCGGGRRKSWVGSVRVEDIAEEARRKNDGHGAKTSWRKRRGLGENAKTIREVGVETGLVRFWFRLERSHVPGAAQSHYCRRSRRGRNVHARPPHRTDHVGRASRFIIFLNSKFFFSLSLFIRSTDVVVTVLTRHNNTI